LRECSPLAATVRALSATELAPRVVDIDVKGEYPESFLRRLGAENFFGAAIPASHGGLGLGLRGLIGAMSEVSRVCGSTAFLAWCQSALVWYLEHTPNAALRERMQRDAMRACILGGTGLSNLMKSCAEIEDLRLSATRVEGGYRLNGVLPWVSNLGEGHWFAVGARLDGVGPLLALVQAGGKGPRLNSNAHFVALEGTRTFACQFKDVFVPDADVLAHAEEFDAFVARIKPGFVLMQTGIALGLIDDCIAIIRQSEESHGHVNRYLDEQAAPLAADLESARTAILELADRISAGRPFEAREVLLLRAAGSELALKASMAAMLHTGAKGYLIRNPAQRRVREAIFVAIVTPALKHLRKELAALEPAAAVH
jgi:hypothetical protein